MHAPSNVAAAVDRGSFRHEALFYAGDEGFVGGVAPFIRQGVENGETVLTVVSRHKVEMLRDELGGAAGQVFFADMLEVGRNPARIIPAWRDFLDSHAGEGRRVRGVGEPIWAGRSAAELIESQRHEALLNVAFADSGPWALLCPYDTSSLPASVLTEARRSHPFLAHGDDTEREASVEFDPHGMAARHLDDELPEPARSLEEMMVGPKELGRLRAAVAKRAKQFGLESTRIDDLMLAVHEVAVNSVYHGGGIGVFRLWREAKALVCEVRDSGRLELPLAGRELPQPEGDGGRGLWLANQLCDLVQIRSLPSGSVVRVHMALDGD